MSGGSQLKLARSSSGTPLGDAIHRAYERGAVVAGTSAGASIMSRLHDLAGRGGRSRPRQRASQISAGLGLVEDVIVDQHFDQRGRYGRLMSRGRPVPQPARHRASTRTPPSRSATARS